MIHVDTLAEHARVGFEVVERKGLGHPDTLCDDLSEVACQALCRYYRDRFGSLLPVKMDQFLLIGAGSRPVFGGGELLGPVHLIVRGTAATVVDGERLPVEDVLLPPLRALLEERLRLPDPARDLEVEWRLREVHYDLARFGRDEHNRAAEDTSLAVGYAPRTALERLVLDLEAHLQSPGFRAACPALGREVKIMAVRQGDRAALTIAAAMLDGLVPDRRAYDEARSAVLDSARTRCLEAGLEPEVAVNTFDDISLELRARSHTGTYRDVHPEAYILVTGSHAEKGTGLTGRGNRINGLITPMQPMSIEAPWGKPPWHPGRLYEVAAFEMAEQVCARTGAHHAAVHLVSRIGSEVGSPDRVLAAVEGGNVSERDVRRVLAEQMARLPELAEALMELPSIPFDLLSGGAGQHDLVRSSRTAGTEV
jgi:S-adenosylmethionine synthetase